MGDYKFIFKTKNQCDMFTDHVNDEELWSKRENDTTLTVCSIFDSTAMNLYTVANAIKEGAYNEN